MLRTLISLMILSLAVLAAPMLPAAAAKAAKPAPAPKATDKTPETTPPPGPAPSPAGFCFKDTPGQYLDVYLDGRAVARYMYANDTSTPDRAHSTFKPYLHVFDAEGKAPITKGPGGQFTHHRGIFFGWKQIGLEGKTYNLWEMASSRQVHQKFLDQTAGADTASFTSLVAWNLVDGKTIIEEERTMTFTRRPAPVLALIDFSTKVKAVAGDLALDGDAEHGGVQYRPANELDRTKTVYCLPKAAVPAAVIDAGTDFVSMVTQAGGGKAAAITKIDKKDLPWAAVAYILGGKRYVVEDMNWPGNPNQGAEWSAYRDYGRFGSFFKTSLKKGETLALKYRFLVLAGEALPTRADLQKNWDEFAQGAAK